MNRFRVLKDCYMVYENNMSINILFVTTLHKEHLLIKKLKENDIIHFEFTVERNKSVLIEKL